MAQDCSVKPIELCRAIGDRDGIFLHFARWQIKARRWDLAQENIAKVTRPELADLKRRLERSLLYRRTGQVDALELPGEIKAPQLKFQSINP